MIKLDGSFLEGGGQLVRTALALSALTGKAFEVENIRSGRPNPGLKAQHLYCIKALKELCNAHAEGDELGSPRLQFVPRKIKPTNLHIDIGTAGSITLLLQSILIPAMFSGKAMRISVAGGTENKWAMPFDYWNNVFVPAIAPFAGKIEVNLIRRGYYPKGNGKVDIKIKPSYSVNDFSKSEDFLKMMRSEGLQFARLEQTPIVQVQGVSNASNDLANAEVAERQARAARIGLAQLNVPVEIQTEYVDTLSTGSVISLWAVMGQQKRIGADALGELRKKSEDVGSEAAKKLITEISSGAPVDKHLADNLIPFLGLVGGEIRASKITNHTRTNIYAAEQFLGKCFEIDESASTIRVNSSV